MTSLSDVYDATMDEALEKPTCSFVLEMDSDISIFATNIEGDNY